MAIRASFMISWSKNSNRFPKDIFLTRTGSKISFIPARCRDRCSEGIMRGAWVEIIIIGTHTLRAPSPLTAASTLTKSKVCADQFVRSAAHTQRKPNGGPMPPGYSSRDDRCGMVRVAAERHVLRRQHRERPIGPHQ